MRITILQGAFLPVPPLRGGAIEKAWQTLGQAFVRAGHEVTHVSRLCDDLPAEETICGVKHIRIKGAEAVVNPYILKLREIPYLVRARRILPDADILVTHTFWAPLFLPSQRMGKLYVHVGRYPKGQMCLYGKAARLQVPSQSVADAVIAELRPGDDARVKCIPYPLPFSMPHPVPLDARPKRVLFAGRIHPEKGVHYLIEAWKSLPISLQNQWTLRLIGPWRKEQGGAGKQFLEQMIHSGGKNIEVLDPVFSEEELIKQYQSAQIFVYPSMARKGETFGLAVLEAMACGCVPLVSSLPCFGDFIRPGKNGFTFDSQKDPVADELTRALNSLLGYTDLSVLSDSAIMRASQYHLDIIADRFLKDFAELINQ